MAKRKTGIQPVIWSYCTSPNGSPAPHWKAATMSPKAAPREQVQHDRLERKQEAGLVAQRTGYPGTSSRAGGRVAAAALHRLDFRRIAHP
jgi:hypothetical protein